MEQLVESLEEEHFEDGECIVRQGETGHFFNIVQSGEISVHKRDEGAGGDGGEEGIGPQVSVLK